MAPLLKRLGDRERTLAMATVGEFDGRHGRAPKAQRPQHRGMTAGKQLDVSIGEALESEHPSYTEYGV